MAIGRSALMRRPVAGLSRDEAPEPLADGGPRSAVALSGLAFPVRRLADEHDALGGTTVAPETASALSRLSGRGPPLPSSVAEPMGEAMGADLSGVRVHADPEADQLSRTLQATAFTHGQDIYFTQGAYAPGSAVGQRLLAHELAHVVQGHAGAQLSSAGGATTIGRASDPAEAAADVMAETALGRLRRSASRRGSGATAQECGRPGLGRIRRAVSAVIRREIVFEEKGPKEKEGVEAKVEAARKASVSFEDELRKAQEALGRAADDDQDRKRLNDELKKIATWFRGWNGSVDKPGKAVPSASRETIAEHVISKHQRVAAILAAAAVLSPKPVKAVLPTQPVAGAPSKAKAGSPTSAPATVKQQAGSRAPAAKAPKPVLSPEERQRRDEEGARKQALHQAANKRAGERKRTLKDLAHAPDVADMLKAFDEDESGHAALLRAAGAATAMLANRVEQALVVRVLAADEKHRAQLASLPPGQVAGYLALVESRKLVSDKDKEIGRALVAGEPTEGAGPYTTTRAVELLTALRMREPTAIADIEWLVQRRAVPEFGTICDIAKSPATDLARFRSIVSNDRFAMTDRLALCRDFELADVAQVLTWPHLDTALVYEHVRLILANPDHWGEANQVIALRAVAHLNKKSAADKFDLLYENVVAFRGQQDDRTNGALDAKTGLFILKFGTDQFALHSHWYQVGTGEIFSMHVAAETPRIKLMDKVFKQLVTKAVEVHNTSPIERPRVGQREHPFKNWL